MLEGPAAALVSPVSGSGGRPAGVAAPAFTAVERPATIAAGSVGLERPLQTSTQPCSALRVTASTVDEGTSGSAAVAGHASWAQFAMPHTGLQALRALTSVYSNDSLDFFYE
jgi:hypothetical protein